MHSRPSVASGRMKHREAAKPQSYGGFKYPVVNVMELLFLEGKEGLLVIARTNEVRTRQSDKITKKRYCSLRSRLDYHVASLLVMTIENMEIMNREVLFNKHGKNTHANMTGDLYQSVKLCRKSFDSKDLSLQTKKSGKREKRCYLPFVSLACLSSTSHNARTETPAREILSAKFHGIGNVLFAGVFIHTGTKCENQISIRRILI